MFQGAKERAELRAASICPYEIIPSSAQVGAMGEEVQEKVQLPGYLGTYGVDCKEVRLTAGIILNKHLTFAIFSVELAPPLQFHCNR